MIDFESFEVLSFDCYGTLIDWESGIVAALRPVLSAHGIELSTDEILHHYSASEPAAQGGEFVDYKHVLRRVVGEFGNQTGFDPSAAELDCLSDSIKDWKPFPDTVDALATLKKSYKLVIISNVDDDLFVETAKQLQVNFDRVITAEQVGSYKPSHRNFEAAFEKTGVPKERFLHVAESLYHDIGPANELGITSVWVNRHSGKQGGGASTTTSATPDLEVPDLKTLVDTIDLGG